VNGIWWGNVYPENYRSEEMITFDRMKELAPDAYQEAISRYPDDAESALLFFCAAIGLMFGTLTALDLDRAKTHLETLDRPDLV
jgi:hypothetical protein